MVICSMIKEDCLGMGKESLFYRNVWTNSPYTGKTANYEYKLQILGNDTLGWFLRNLAGL